MQRIDRYELQDELGRGGMGVVYRAWDPHLRREVALKVLVTPRDPDALRRFEHEVAALSRLDHPHIVTTWSSGHTPEGRPYLVMDLVEGEPLSRLLARQGRMPPPDAVRLLIPIARALEAAHAQGVLHRDLKPENILVGRDGQPQLADFGLAKLTDLESLTQTGEVLGTPGFLSPEQAYGSKRDYPAATDVYGLGATLYALVTGQPPFDASTPVSMIHAVLTRRPLPPSKLNPDVDGNLDAIVLRCLEKRPEDRYARVRELRHALEDYRREVPGPREPAATWLVAASAALGALALTGGVAAWVVASSDVAPPPARAQVATPPPSPEPESSEPESSEPEPAEPEPRASSPPPSIEPAPAMANTVSQLAFDRYRAALALQQRGELRRAHEAISVAIEEQPRWALAVAFRGTLRAELGEIDDAIVDLTRAHELDPRMVQPLHIRGQLYLAQRRIEPALSDLMRALELDPSNAPAWHGLGCVQADLGQWVEAERSLDQAIALDPEAFKALAMRGGVRVQVGRYHEGVADLDRAIEVAPDYVDAWRSRGVAFYRQGRYTEALPDFQRVVRLFPQSAPDWVALGNAHTRLEQYDPARQAYERAIAADPNHVDAHLNRGAVEALSGDHRAALGHFTRALAIAPRDPNASFNRGLSYLELGELERARADLLLALEGYPAGSQGRGEAREALAELEQKQRER